MPQSRSQHCVTPQGRASRLGTYRSFSLREPTQNAIIEEQGLTCGSPFTVVLDGPHFNHHAWKASFCTIAILEGAQKLGA